MFRKSKKFIAMALAVAMMMSMSTSVFAVENTDTDGTMFEEYNPETGETSELFIPSDPSAPNYTSPNGETSFEGVQPAITPYNYKPGWKRAPSLTATPYKAIVKLTTTYQNNTKGHGTGFIVGDGKILTAAHNLYDMSKGRGGWAKQVEIFFEKNGSSDTHKEIAVTTLVVNATWKTVTGSDDDTEGLFTYDYGFIRVPKETTDGITKFRLYSGVFVNNPYTITGYPWVEGSSAYTGNYMYTDTDDATEIYLGAAKHDINICGGVSGAPMYGSNNYVVGIQTYGHSYLFDGKPSGGITEPTQFGGFATLITPDIISFASN